MRSGSDVPPADIVFHSGLVSCSRPSCAAGCTYYLSPATQYWVFSGPASLASRRTNQNWLLKSIERSRLPSLRIWNVVVQPPSLSLSSHYVQMYQSVHISSRRPEELPLLHSSHAQRVPLLLPDPHVIRSVQFAQHRNTFPAQELRINVARRGNNGDLSCEGRNAVRQLRRDAVQCPTPNDMISFLSLLHTSRESDKQQKRNSSRPGEKVHKKSSGSPTLNRESQIPNRARPTNDQQILTNLFHLVL